MNWQILSKASKDIIETLLKNRGIKDKKEFFEPLDPLKIPLKSLNIKESEIKKAIDRIKKARENKESVIVYGDYDADGITATAIMWETLHEFGLDVLPHIPDRFEEGYGINAESVTKLKARTPNLKLIVTVDNGIVAYEGIKKAKDLGIDVIVVDHHQKGTKKLATPYVLHATAVCGSALAWFFAKELSKSIKYPVSSIMSSLELAAIGTIADQMPLIGINRSIVKYGLEQLNKTRRPGLLALFEESGLTTKSHMTGSHPVNKVGTYEVNYIIAPRINAMGRLAAGIDSLRLLCTKRADKALELSKLLSKTNLDRQKIVDEAVVHAQSEVRGKSKGHIDKVIVLVHKSYHEGVIGLVAGKLVEEFYRPAIVLSKKGKESKASARSVSGFNIIEAIKATGLILEGGGHPMAAGFSIDTKLIPKFTREINKIADKLLTDEMLQRKLKIDMELSFDQLDDELSEKLEGFNPTGLGNPAPIFATKNVEIVEVKKVGAEGKHLKIRLADKPNEHIFNSIYFGGGQIYSKLTPDIKIDVAYNLENNTWNGYKSLQLKVKDIITH